VARVALWFLALLHERPAVMIAYLGVFRVCPKHSEAGGAHRKIICTNDRQGRAVTRQKRSNDSCGGGSRHRPVDGSIMETDLLEHPAVKAWIKLQPDGVEPESIETLDTKKRAWIKLRSERVQPQITEILKRKRFMYRLKGVGREGSAVIAKQCKKGTGMMEHTIYTEILSRLPVPTLRCYGFVEQPSGELGWLFVEDAGTERFRISEHRALAARWLGLMHTSAVHVAATAHLPDRGPDNYVEHLRLARDTIQRAVINSALSPDDQVVLESIISQCDALETRWDKVEKFCDRMPQTLVHSDFNQANIRVQHGQTGIALLPFDWEMAGRGIPAADLACLEHADLAIYRSVVRRSWPYLGVQDVQQMAYFGRIFGALADINWQSWRLEYPWESWPLDKDEQIKWTVMHMKFNEISIADAMRAATWED
jgi:hypothetical protein